MKRIIDPLSKFLNIGANLVVLFPFITFGIAVLGSYYSTGNFLLWISAIPVYTWVILVLSSAVVLIIRRKQEVAKSKNYLPERFVYSPDSEIIEKAYFYGTKECAQVPYKGVLWSIEMINDPLFDYFDGREKVDTLLVKIPPKCNKCKTELSESLNFWGGYIWECERCHFVKKTQTPFLIAGSKALTVAISEIREKLQK